MLYDTRLCSGDAHRAAQLLHSRRQANAAVSAFGDAGAAAGLEAAAARKRSAALGKVANRLAARRKDGL